MNRLSAALAALLLPLPATLPANPVDPIELDEVVVTGTRTEVTLADSLVPAQVIDRAQIERSQAGDLIELLRGRAGIDIGNTGGRGKLSSLYLRGAESDHVLVLVDGIKINSATAGMPAIQSLPLAQIERIEVIRGPRSSLYGSEAVGGVIQIFTRGASARGFRPHLLAGGGSHASREFEAGFDHRGERGWIGVHGGYASTDGINACRGSGTLFTGCFTDEPDRDGYRNVSFNLRGGLRLGEALDIEGSFLDAAGENAFDGSWSNRSQTLQQAASLQLRHAPVGGRLALHATLGRSRDRSRDDHDGDFRSLFDTRRDSASLQADLRVTPGHRLSLGVDHSNDRVDSTTAYAARDRENTGLFLAWDGTRGAHRFQASVRNDDNEQFGSHLTGSLGWGMAIGGSLRLNATLGSGFKAPTFNDLYYPGSESPWLRPEESVSFNLGLAQSTTRHRWTLDLFESRIDDLVVFTYPPPDYLGIGENIDEARIRGAEFTYATDFAGFDLSLQLNHVDPRDRSGGANDGNVLARRARNTGRIDLDRAFGPFRAGVSVQGAGARYDDAANTVRLGGYATTDLRLEYAFHRDWTLLARVGNVFDRSYETVAWYNQPGREYQLSLRWQPVPR
jgi:vitamin B12 transporter